jgi:site-specific DNA-methyltransferase (adenine-specific)
MELRVADWQDTLKAVPPGAASLILTDPPYGTTCNSWDNAFDLDAFWTLAWRALPPTGAVVMTSQEPFTSKLIASQPTWFKYCWYWNKVLGTGHLNAKRQPLRNIEPVAVFYRKQTVYSPQMTVDERGNRSWHRQNTQTGSYNDYGEATYSSGGLKYPTSLITIYQAPKTKTHPTEKPLALMEYFVSTYTNEGDLVVDPFVGSGTTAIACRNLKRRFIGGDMNPEYVEMAQLRLAEPAPGPDP